MKKAFFYLCLVFLFSHTKFIQAHGFGAHTAHLQKIIELNLPGSYLDIITDSRYKPYFIYGSMFPDLQYTANYKSTLQDLYQKVEDIDGVLGLTYEIPLDAIPSTDTAPYPFGINTHHDKYAMAFAEYLFIQSGLPDPPGPDPGYESQTDSKNRKIAFALGYYAHLAEDVAAHNFLIPKLTATLNLGDIELIKNSQNFEEDPNAQQEGIIEGIIDHYYGDNNLVEQTIYWDVWVHYNQKEPTLAQMNPFNWTYDDEMYDPVRHNNMINPVLVFFHEVLNDWYNNNPDSLPAVGINSYKETYAPITLNGLYQLATVFRFVNRFYPAIAGHPYNGYDRLDQVLADYIGNHLDIGGGWDPVLILGDFLQIVSEVFDFRRHLFEQIAYPSALATTNAGLASDARSLTSLMLADMEEADRLVNSEPDLVNIIEYNKLKNSILFTNPHSILDSFWDEYIALGSRIYAEIGPPNKWYTDWSPWHKQSMAWGVLSSLNNSIPDIYTSNQNVAIYDAFFEVNTVRIIGPQLPLIFQNNPVVKTKVELYNTSNVPSESITLKVKRDHNSTDYSLDPLKTSTTFSIDHDPLLYNTNDRKKVELIVPSVSLTDLVNYRGYYMEVVKNSNNKAMFSSSFEQYQERLDLTPNYARLYGSYDQDKWPVSLGLARSVATVNLNAAQFPEGGGSGGSYKINGITQGTITGCIDDYINLEAVPPAGWSFYKWSDDNLDNPRTFRITSTNTNLYALYKGIQVTNTSSAYSFNCQNKFLKTPNGYLHNVYESMGNVWYEQSTDGGITWAIMNNGLPVNYNDGSSNAKSPAISSSNDSDDPFIYIAYQADNVWGNTGAYVILTQFYHGLPRWPITQFVSDVLPSYSYDTKPVVTGLNQFAMVVYKSHSNAPLTAVEFRVNASGDVSQIIPRSFPSAYVSGNSTLPSITNSGGIYHLAYQDAVFTIRYLRWFVNTNPVTSNYYSIPSAGSGYTFNTEPAISSANFNPVISWKGAQYDNTRAAVLRRGTLSGSNMIWSDFLKVGSNINYVHSNSASNSTEKTVMTWSQDGSTTKWVRRTYPVNGKTEYSSPQGLNPSGINSQVSSGTDYNNLKANIFRSSSPLYYFTQSTTDFSVLQEQGGELNKSTVDDTLVTFGRSGVAEINGVEFVFNIGDILAGDSIIQFINKPDTIVYASSNELNEFTRTNNFVLSTETNFYFSNIYYVAQKSDPDTALTNTDAVNFRAELVNAITNQVVGTFDNITYNKNNLDKYASIDYEVDCSGITPGDYYLRLVTNVNTIAEYALANIINDNTTLAKKNFNKVNFTGSEIPITYELSNNFPNPFNPSTTIRYQIPQDGIVTLKIYDILGSEVATLVNEEKLAGKYEVNFNASSLASGVYIYKIQAGSFINSKKMILLK